MPNVRSEYAIGLKDELTGPLGRMTSGLDKFKVAVAALGAIGVAGSIASVTSRIKSAVDLADGLSKAAQRAGVTVESFSALDYAASLADVSTESLQGALQKLARTMAQAAAGGRTQAAAFNAIGVEIKGADGALRGADDVIADIAVAFAKLPEGATKTALAMQLFGRAGAELIPLLNGNADGFKAVTAEAKQFGVVVSSQLAQASENLNDNFTRLEKAASALGITLASDIVPGLANLTTEFVKNYSEASGLLRVFDALGTSIAGLARGSDQQRLGQLLADEIELEKKIADVQAAFDRGDTGKLVAVVRLKLLRDELARTKAEAEGLKAVLPPEQQGQGRTTPASTGPTAEEKAREAARVQAALDDAQAATKRQAERDKLAKAEDDYLAKLRQQLAIEGESTELAKVKADIQFGAAAKFGPAAQAEAQSLAEQLDVLKESAEVHQALAGYVKERAQLEDQATKQLADHRQAVIDSLQTPLEKYIERIKELQSLDLNGETLQRGIKAARLELEDAQSKASGLSDAVHDLGLTFTSAFEDAIVSGNSLSSVLKGLASDIARILVRKSVTEPLAGLLSGSDGNPGFLQQLAGGFGTFIGGLFGGGKAAGGAVSAGKYYMVGENGPELFAPGRSGSIIPGAEGGGWNLTVINNTPAPVTQRQTGRRSLEVTVGDLLAGNVASGRGGAFGLRPALAGR